LTRGFLHPSVPSRGLLIIYPSTKDVKPFYKEPLTWVPQALFSIITQLLKLVKSFLTRGFEPFPLRKQ